MKRTLLYMAVLCFTAAFSQKISDLLSAPQSGVQETYDSYRTHRVGLAKKNQAEKKLYTYAAATRLKNYKFGDYLIVTSNAADIRSGEGADFKSIQTVKKDGLLKFHSYQGHWVKVAAVDSGKTGYIYYKDIK